VRPKKIVQLIVVATILGGASWYGFRRITHDQTLIGHWIDTCASDFNQELSCVNGWTDIKLFPDGTFKEVFFLDKDSIPTVATGEWSSLNGKVTFKFFEESQGKRGKISSYFTQTYQVGPKTMTNRLSKPTSVVMLEGDWVDHKNYDSKGFSENPMEEPRLDRISRVQIGKIE
jgi:hypothetical protein